MSTAHDSSSRIERGSLCADFAPSGVPYAVVLPPGYDSGETYPLCLVLHGGGGSCENLVECQSLFDEWWAAGSVAPMVLASLTTSPMSYYLDHPDGRYRWETLIAEQFLAHLRGTYGVPNERASTGIAGISMGGHGALKIAFRRPHQFAAVAALEPTIEPGLDIADAKPRNRFYSHFGGPQELIGPDRDPALFVANNPANRLRDNVDAIRDHGLAIYVEAGDHDALHVHDGTEFLHRILWDLDISHEYHLVRGADHVGPSLRGRMHEAYGWLGAVLTSSPPSTAEQGTESGPRSPAEGGLDDQAVHNLRTHVAQARQQAAAADPTMRRRFAILPSI